MWIRNAEKEYLLNLKWPMTEDDKITHMVVCANRAEIKDKHLILYKNDSVVYYCPIDRIDSFYEREV